MDKYYVYYDNEDETGLIQLNSEEEVNDFITKKMNNTDNLSLSNFIVVKGKKLKVQPVQTITKIKLV